MPVRSDTIDEPRVVSGPSPCGEGCADPLVTRVCALHHTLMRNADRVLAPVGLTASRLMLLKRVDAAGDAPTVTWLSGQLAMSTQAVSRMVATLERHRMVSRTVRPGGGRSVFVELTPAGKRSIEEAMRILGGVSRGLRAGMDAGDEHALIGGLDQMLRNLQTFEESGPSGSTNR